MLQKESKYLKYNFILKEKFKALLLKIKKEKPLEVIKILTRLVYIVHLGVLSNVSEDELIKVLIEEINSIREE